MSERLERSRRFMNEMWSIPFRSMWGGYNPKRANLLEAAVLSLLHHLESHPSPVPQTPESEDSSRITVSLTKDDLSAALVNPIEAAIRLSERLHGALTEAERTAVANDSSLADLWGQLVSLLSTRARVARGTSWTSLKQELKLSAEPESSAPSPSRESEGEDRGTYFVPAHHRPSSPSPAIQTERCPEMYRDLHDYEICTFPKGHEGKHSFSLPSPAIHAQGEEA